MIRTRATVIGGSLALLAASVAGAPASAAPNVDIAFVNGIPGKKVDICVNKKEVKSAVRYGGKALRKIGSGSKVISFRAKSPGKCKGKVLAKKTLLLSNGDDLTVVGTKKSPKKVTVFDNILLGPLPALVDTATAWRHAANVKDVGFIIGFAPIDFEMWEHAGDDIWNKGDELVDAAVYGSQTHIMSMDVVVPFSEFWYPGSRVDVVYPGLRYEWIFVGSNSVNTKIVKIARLLDV